MTSNIRRRLELENLLASELQSVIALPTAMMQIFADDQLKGFKALPEADPKTPAKERRKTVEAYHQKREEVLFKNRRRELSLCSSLVGLGLFTRLASEPQELNALLENSTQKKIFRRSTLGILLGTLFGPFIGYFGKAGQRDFETISGDSLTKTPNDPSDDLSQDDANRIKWQGFIRGATAWGIPAGQVSSMLASDLLSRGEINRKDREALDQAHQDLNRGDTTSVDLDPQSNLQFIDLIPEERFESENLPSMTLKLTPYEGAVIELQAAYFPEAEKPVNEDDENIPDPNWIPDIYPINADGTRDTKQAAINLDGIQKIEIRF